MHAKHSGVRLDTNSLVPTTFKESAEYLNTCNLAVFFSDNFHFFS